MPLLLYNLFHLRRFSRNLNAIFLHMSQIDPIYFDFILEHADQIAWIQARLRSAAEDREEDGNEHVIVL